MIRSNENTLLVHGQYYLHDHTWWHTFHYPHRPRLTDVDTMLVGRIQKTRAIASPVFQTWLWCRLPGLFKTPSGQPMSRLLSNGEKRTDLDNDLPVCNVENTDVTDEEIPYVHVCTGCYDQNKPITGTPDEDPIKKRETRDEKVQATERHAPWGEVTSLKDSNVNQQEWAHWRKATTQIGMRRSEIYVVHSGLLFQTSMIHGCLHNVVRVSLRLCIRHEEQRAPLFRPTGEQCMYKTMGKKMFWQKTFSGQT